jgi:hypothetical protein
VDNTWVTAPPADQPHGDAAKKDNTVAGQGFPYCKTCHGGGTNFSGGTSGVSCYTCHGVSAPHAPKPWRASAGSTYTHTTTAEAGNAPVCAQCHFPGSPNNPANHPATPAAAGTPPGCFNSTLCHGEAAAPHPIGSTWVTTSPAAQPHGDAAKEDGTVAGQGFPYCKTCHGTGTNFSGGTSGVSCYTCHGVSAPHAPKPWRSSAGSVYTHTDTAETGNAPVCAQCHYPGSPNNPANHPATPAAAGTPPGCFNNTLCHGPTFHPTDWAQATQHGSVAKQAPSGPAGFAYCQACHGTGTNFLGGITGVSCYPCHGVNAPHPSGATWVNSSTPTHQTTDPGNAAVCAFCHQSNPGTPGCFNDTLCHGS